VLDTEEIGRSSWNRQRVAWLVTGTNKGIGFEVARQLGKAGCTVVIGARKPELGRTAAAKLLDQQVDARFVALDQSKRSRRAR
jgi:NAD(P)-dependent dehydrogenase (short-subunit alcohol dehydrogenase family)